LRPSRRRFQEAASKTTRAPRGALAGGCLDAIGVGPRWSSAVQARQAASQAPHRWASGSLRPQGRSVPTPGIRRGTSRRS